MDNVIFLESYTSEQEYFKSFALQLPLESFITYCIYRHCSPALVTLHFTTVKEVSISNNIITIQCREPLKFDDELNIPWQVASCIYPVVKFEDTIITGLCAVARHICKFRSSLQLSEEHDEGLLGFRKSCLQAPNEVSIWTKFCEVDIIKSIINIINSDTVQEIPINLVRFENHLNKPVRVHNVYKVARDMKKEKYIKNNKILNDTDKSKEDKKRDANAKTRVVKTRNWKSNLKKELEINSSIKIEDLNLIHQFAEGPFLTLADLILLPSYHILIQTVGEKFVENSLPLTFKWFKNLTSIPKLQPLIKLLGTTIKKGNIINILDDVFVPSTEDVSLYKCDPKRHNPKKRSFTKEIDIENALSTLMAGMELEVVNNVFEDGIDWDEIPSGANPLAGHLPDIRMARKSQQLENLALAVLKVAKDGDLIVDFCSGGGHLGILVAHLLPKCTIILLENKEQSLSRARQRVHNMGLKNVYYFQCNLDFFIGNFDIGIALHACGIASDLVLNKCLKANAKFVLCPCCYGSLHSTDRLVYPRSNRFSNVSIAQYLCIGHAADQTHDDHPLTIRGAKCMAIIDSDRGRLAEESGYKVTLSRLKPLSCTPKNNLLIGVPS